MKLSLVSDNKKSFVNFDFTKFFSEKRNASHYKQMIKNLVDKYININTVNEYEKSPIYIIDMWFRQALEEELTAPQKDFLQQNYEMFRKMYKFDGNVDKLIEKFNNIKKPLNNRNTSRFKAGECSCLTNGLFILIYDKCERLKECTIDINNIEGAVNDEYKNNIITLYENIIDKSDYKFNVAYKSLKTLSKGLDNEKRYHYVSLNDYIYNIGLIITYLDNKEDIELWQYDGRLLLRQSDRDIILMYNNLDKSRFEHIYEVNRLEDYKE